MKKRLLGFVVVLVGVMFALGVVSFPAFAVPPPAPINKVFPDPVLAQTIASKLGKSITDVVTIQELETINGLNKEGKEGFPESMPQTAIATLEGIQYCKNMNYLVLNCNAISDLTPISNLTSLARLELRQNKIISIKPLLKLTNLKILNLSYNKIAKIDSLANKFNLKKLVLHMNQISSWQFGYLANLSDLTELSASYNKITYLLPFKKLVGLEYLDLSSNEIDDIEDLAALIKLKTLWISSGSSYSKKMSDISVLKELPKLESISFCYHKISDLKPLQNLPNLKHIDAAGNNIADIQPLVDNPGVGKGDFLSLTGNPVLNSETGKKQIQQLMAKGVGVQI